MRVIVDTNVLVSALLSGRSPCARLVNALRDAAEIVSDLPHVAVCADPCDDYLLAMIVAGKADYLVTGDKRDLPGMGRYEGGRVIGVADFLAMFGPL